MGTRGKSQKDMDLIGSVTGEVIEVNKVPVLAIPENVPFEDLSEAKNIAFATSFNQRDLVAFDEFMEIIKPYNAHIHLFNISTSKNEWNEIRLTGVNDISSSIRKHISPIRCWPTATCCWQSKSLCGTNIST